ncbi:phosphotransferase [Rhizobium ruizarguesonis]
MSDGEIPMTSGRVTAGVVRLGNTIRRPITADRSHVHDLLRCLEEQQFSGVPRFLGIDERNREILSFLDGNVPSDLDHFHDEQLSAAAALLRRFHDTTVSLVRTEASADEVICHNDWGPPNAVFVDGLPTGIIDFDTISPGLRLWDLGYSAFTWLDLGNPDYTGDEQIRRLSVFASGYGLKQCSAAAIAAYAVARQTALAVSGKMHGNIDMATWAEASAAWTVLNVTERLIPTGYLLNATG